MIVLLVAALAATALVLRARSRDGDLPQRIVAAGANGLPAHRRVWGQALVAELAAIPGRGQRWRFATAVLRIVLFPPAPKPAAARATAAISILLTVGATLATVRLLPTLSLFVAVVGLLMSCYATALACRRPGVPATPVRLAAAAAVVLGVLAAVGAVSAVAAVHPAATRDETHIFSVVLAVVLCGYLIAGLHVVTGGATPATIWGGLAGAGIAVAVSAVVLPAQGVLAPISLGTAAATLATTLGVAAVTGNRVAATRAGLLAAILATPVQFAVALIVAQSADPLVLTNPYDIAAYPRSGYPDVASYLLSDMLGGDIIILAVTLLVMYPLAVATAAMTPRMHRGRWTAR